MNIENKGLLVAIICLCGALTAPLRASDTECDPEDPLKCSTPLREGEKAPYTGQILSPKLAIDLGQKAYFCDERLDLTLKFERAKLQVDLGLEKQLRIQDREAWEAKEKVLMRELEASRSRPFYEHPLFVATVSVVLTVGVVWAAKEVLEAQN